MTFYHPHNRVSIDCGDFSHTKQSCKEECDINNILKQYKKTGIMTHISNASASYLDLPTDFDYQSALNTVMEAEQAFAELPSKVRDRFGNDPYKFLAGLEDPAIRPELEELGLFKPKPPAPAAPAAPDVKPSGESSSSS